MGKTLKVLDLFSGIGGFSLGLESTGLFETVAFCEKDETCQRVLRKHWEDDWIPIFSDITKLKNEKSLTGKFNQLSDDNITFGPAEIDVICGSFPCQDISEAGLKKGFEDESGERTRSGLWFEFKRIIEEVRPKWVIIENVANLRNIGLGQVLKDLWESGYDSEWRVISARSIGSCHTRERIWIVAYPSDTKRIGQVLSEHVSRPGRDTSRLEKELSERFGTNTPLVVTPRIFKSGHPPISDRWKAKSQFFRVDDGIPSRLDKDCVRRQRVKQLGNSVVPQIVAYIGKLIAENDS